MCILDDSILNEIVECTNEEAERKQNNFRMTKKDLLAFNGVQFCRGIYCKGVPVREMWSENFNIAMVKKLSSRNKFVKIMKFLRFDHKSTRIARSTEDKFALCSKIWNKFIENSK